MQDIKAISVSQLNTYIHNVFVAEELLHNIYIVGEVSGFKISGEHAYFTLKDAGGAIAINDFKYRTKYIPKEGEQIFIKGTVDYFAKNGRLSFNAASIIPNGEGALAAKLAELKAKLQEQGYFDVDRKKPIPPFCKRVCVITSKTGAVIRDIITTTRKHNSLIDLIVYDVRVQGSGAENEIALAIETADDMGYDCIIIARGGGSLEDLMPFNTEIIVKAIYNAKTPIISAVGHETDFSLSDYAADHRSATPTAAAEKIAYEESDLRQYYLDIANKLAKELDNKMLFASKDFSLLQHKLKGSFDVYYSKNMNNIYTSINKISNLMDNCILNNQHKLDKLITKLDAYNPTTIFKSGYMFAEKNGKRIDSVKQLKTGDIIELKSHDGQATAEIKEVK